MPQKHDLSGKTKVAGQQWRHEPYSAAEHKHAVSKHPKDPSGKESCHALRGHMHSMGVTALLAKHCR